MARPKKEIDEIQLKGLMRMKPTLKDVAAFFECSEDTIERRIKALSGVSFAEFRDQNMVHTRFHLVRTALKRSEHSDTMLIFCLKNLCEWSDKRPGDAEVVVNNFPNQTTDDLKKRAKELAAEILGTDGSDEGN